MKLSVYDQTLASTRKEYICNLHILKAYKPLFPIAEKIQKDWSLHTIYQNDETRYSNLTYAIGVGTINALAVNLYLSPKDSIKKNVGLLIVDDLNQDSRFRFIDNSNAELIEWTSWDYSYLLTKFTNKYNIVDHPKLMIRAWYKRSTKCKLVGTGEFKETKKLVCEE